jgi:hypothetical protein
MLPDPKIKCPATGFAKSCREIIAEHDCPKFVSIKGHDPQSGNPVDRFGCVDSFLPLLLIENAQMSRQTGAAVESFRNEVVKAEQEKREALLQFARDGGPRLVGSGN